MTNSVVIDGVPYVRDPQYANRVSFWWMHDNHTFTRLQGDTLDALSAHAEQLHAEEEYGMLCPAVLLHNDKEIRRVPAGWQGQPHEWPARLTWWRTAMEADADVTRILAAGGNHV